MPAFFSRTVNVTMPRALIGGITTGVSVLAATVTGVAMTSSRSYADTTTS